MSTDLLRVATGEGTSGMEPMIQFLNEMLHKLEAAQGGIDEEARAGLELLRKKAAELESAKVRAMQAEAPTSTASTPPTNIDIAHKIDRLQTDLSSLEVQLDGMDETTKSLFTHSAALWLGDEPPSS